MPIRPKVAFSPVGLNDDDEEDEGVENRGLLSNAQVDGVHGNGTDVGDGHTGDDAPSKLKWHLILLLCQCLWSGMHLVNTPALRAGDHPFVLAAMREVLAVPCLGAAAAYLEWGKCPRLGASGWAWMALLGFVGVGCVRGFVMIALDFCGPDITAALTPCTPMWALVLSVAFGLETLALGDWTGWAKIAGLLLCLGGTSAMALWQGPAIAVGGSGLLQSTYASLGAPGAEAAPQRLALGIAFMMGNCISYAAYSILNKVAMERLHTPPVTTAALTIAFGAASEVVLALATAPLSRFAITRAGIIAVAYSGPIASALCYLLVSSATRHLDATTVTIYIPAQPLTTVLLSTVLLGDPFYSSTLVGAVAIMSGVALVLFAKRQEGIAAGKLTKFNRMRSAVFLAMQVPGPGPSVAPLKHTHSIELAHREMD